METTEDVKKYVIDFMEKCIEHHKTKMIENVKDMDFYYADKNKGYRDLILGMKCQLEADFKHKIQFRCGL